MSEGELIVPSKEEVEIALSEIKIRLEWEGCEIDEGDIGQIVSEAIRKKLEPLADEGIIEFLDEDYPEPDTWTVVKTATDKVIRSYWVAEVIRINNEVYDVWVYDYSAWHWGQYEYAVSEVSLVPHGESP